MPAAAWAARSGDAVLFAQAGLGAGRRPRKALTPHEAQHLRARPAERRSRTRVEPQLRQARHGARASRGRRPSRTRSRSPASAAAASAGASSCPGHNFTVASTDAARATPPRRRRSPRRRVRAAAAHRQAPTAADAAGELLADVQPGYERGPGPGVYNRVWILGDDGCALGATRRRRIDRITELVPVAGPRAPLAPAASNLPRVSEYERPDRAEREPTVEDVRQLMGASTPHFALQIAQPHPELSAGCRPTTPRASRASARSRASSALADGSEHRGPIQAPRGGAGAAELPRRAPARQPRPARRTAGSAARPRARPRARGARARCRAAAPSASRALQEEVEVVLPGEADAAVHLERRGGHAPAARRTRRPSPSTRPAAATRARRRRPSRRSRRAERALLDLAEHLRAAVRDRLVGADRAAELLAVLRVLDGHLHARAGATPDELGGERDRDPVERPRRRRRGAARRRRRGRAT